MRETTLQQPLQNQAPKSNTTVVHYRTRNNIFYVFPRIWVDDECTIFCRPVKKEALWWALTNCSTAIIAGGGLSTAQHRPYQSLPSPFLLIIIILLLALYHKANSGVTHSSLCSPPRSCQSTPTKDRPKKYRKYQ
jgi:hypothetical protein